MVETKYICERVCNSKPRRSDVYFGYNSGAYEDKFKPATLHAEAICIN